jgi:2-polyprenyl-3-methyl-5-hydroxy-6-metoxy-1,4-benzoquinol methylase
VVSLLQRSGVHRCHHRIFIRPEELAAAAGAAGFPVTELGGMRHLPFLHHPSQTRDNSVNYIATFAGTGSRVSKVPA